MSSAFIVCARRTIAAASLFVGISISACQGSHTRVPTPTPLPSPVTIPSAPSNGATLSDPTFDALPHATAHYGTLGGMVYNVEIPDDWNGGLVVWLPTAYPLTPADGQQLFVRRPEMRSYLIRSHFAWASTSYTRTDLKPGAAADDAAALWDIFAQQFGAPKRAFVTGVDLGGGGALIAAGRYADRFTGVLSFCAIAGSSAHHQIQGDYALAAAYVTGVSQAEWDSSTPNDIVVSRVGPVLQTYGAQDQLVSLLIRMTGGPRPLDTNGYLPPGSHFSQYPDFDNRHRQYVLSDSTEPFGKGIGNVPSAEYNRKVIRYAGAAADSIDQSEEFSGDLNIPALTVNLTGDREVPISEAQLIRQKATERGNESLLSQRTVQSSKHCELTSREREDAFEALVLWVDGGNKPAEENLSDVDLRMIGASFTQLPRLGSLAADVTMASAHDRLTIFGNVTRDGAPFDSGFLRVIVERDGLLADCRQSYSSIGQGVYTRVVAPASEQAGCGGPGAHVYLETDNPASRNVTVFSTQAIDWPAGRDPRVRFDAKFLTADPLGISKQFTELHGDVLDAAGAQMPPRTKIDAYIGSTLCGTTSVSPIATLISDGYFLLIAGPDSIPTCTQGAPVTLEVNNVSVDARVVNDLAGSIGGRQIDLQLPEAALTP